MAEIKSTLDIIMEKTKHFTLTEKEKKAFKKKEIEGKVRGLILKFIDGFMDLKMLKQEIASFDQKNQMAAIEAVTEECLGRIDPEAENRPFLDILEQVAGLDTASLNHLLSKFHRDLDHEKDALEQDLREQLLKKDISGSAIQPNIRADRGWIDYVQKAKEGFRKELQALIAQH